ncbi:MAG: hydantoinase/oxoprolinase family protein, partial [Myxococcota bacterium]
MLIDAVDTEADSERIERDDWAQIRTPSSPRANHNQILRARLGPADVDPAIETVAAGGGSVCWFDGQRPVVGPRSAGAEPGPACYGRGGPLSVTDVNLYLGKILPEHFA